jgi:N-methylhydantoinase A
MRQIRVGPESAASEPGPASYRRGGTRPAVTDADLLLGRLDPAAFAGGAIPLDPALAETAIAHHIAEPLGLDPLAAAHGVAEMVDETMANAARVHAVENGEDLGDYTMIAFGGAAPLHAGRLCEKLGIDRLLVPPGAGVGSAIGFLRAPFAFEATRSLCIRLDAFDAVAVRSLLHALRDEATAFVRACDATAPIATTARAYMRYRGQGWEIPVPIPDDLALAPDGAGLLALFEAEYAALFDRTVRGMAVETTVWTVNATTPAPPAHPVAPPAAAAAAPATPRRLYDPASARLAPARETPRARLTDGVTLQGPAAITEAETTIILPAGFTATGRADGCIDIRRA